MYKKTNNIEILQKLLFSKNKISLKNMKNQISEEDLIKIFENSKIQIDKKLFYLLTK